MSRESAQASTQEQSSTQRRVRRLKCVACCEGRSVLDMWPDLALTCASASEEVPDERNRNRLSVNPSHPIDLVERHTCTGEGAAGPASLVTKARTAHAPAKGLLQVFQVSPHAVLSYKSQAYWPYFKNKPNPYCLHWC